MRLSVKISWITKRRWNLNGFSRNYRQVSIHMLYIEYEKEKLDNRWSAVKTIAINRLNIAIISYNLIFYWIYIFLAECYIYRISNSRIERIRQNTRTSINKMCLGGKIIKRNKTSEGEHITLEFRKNTWNCSKEQQKRKIGIDADVNRNQR